MKVLSGDLSLWRRIGQELMSGSVHKNKKRWRENTQCIKHLQHKKRVDLPNRDFLL